MTQINNLVGLIRNECVQQNKVTTKDVSWVFKQYIDPIYRYFSMD